MHLVIFSKDMYPRVVSSREEGTGPVHLQNLTLSTDLPPEYIYIGVDTKGSRVGLSG